MALSATNRNEPYLPLPTQPKLVLIYRPRRDERPSKKSIQDRCTLHWASECTELLPESAALRSQTVAQVEVKHRR